VRGKTFAPPSCPFAGEMHLEHLSILCAGRARSKSPAVDFDPTQGYVPDGTFQHREEPLDESKLVVKLGGELDMFISPSISRRFHEIAEDGERDVVVDLSEVRYIDSTVLETFVHAQRELQDHEHALVVVAPEPYTQRTFELTGLTDVLRVCGSRDEALTKLTA
jgi:anti-anti-sigma factor